MGQCSGKQCSTTVSQEFDSIPGMQERETMAATAAGMNRAGPGVPVTGGFKGGIQYIPTGGGKSKKKKHTKKKHTKRKSSKRKSSKRKSSKRKSSKRKSSKRK